MLIPEIVRRATESYDQVVIEIIADRGLEQPVLHIHVQDLGYPDVHVPGVLKDLPQRKRDAGGLQPGRRHLVHEGLELMVVVFVDEKDLVIRPVQLTCQTQPAKAGSNDNDPLFAGGTNLAIHPCIGMNQVFALVHAGCIYCFHTHLLGSVVYLQKYDPDPECGG